MTRAAWTMVTLTTLMVMLASIGLAEAKPQAQEQPQTWQSEPRQDQGWEQPKVKPQAQTRPGAVQWRPEPQQGWQQPQQGWQQPQGWERGPAGPSFGNQDFQACLQQELGLWGPQQGYEQPCPMVRGVPVPRSWGREWWPADDWMQYVARNGVPPGQRGWELPETPDQKWAQQVQGYRAWLMSHPFDGSWQWHQRNDHFMQYLEQNWYNYWHRLRFGQNPPNHESNYFGWGFGREGW